MRKNKDEIKSLLEVIEKEYLTRREAFKKEQMMLLLLNSELIELVISLRDFTEPKELKPNYQSHNVPDDIFREYLHLLDNLKSKCLS